MKKLLLSSVAAAVLALGTTLAVAQTGTPGGGAGARGSDATNPPGAAGGAAVNKVQDEKTQEERPRQTVPQKAQDGSSQGQKAADQKGQDQRTGEQKAPAEKAANQKVPDQKAQDQKAPARSELAQPGSADKTPDKASARQQPTGAIGSTSVTSEQRTQLREKSTSASLRRATNVDFTISVGARIPRTVTYYSLPPDIVRIVPAYRRYKYIVVGNQLLIIDPRRNVIVDVLDV
jgi:outer membrane biosynthesis protein TonB